jgi:hypothetical protein
MASMATPTLPSVPFLNPIGKAEPEASSRWSCDSVVRAPIAPQVMQSAMNWGLDVSWTPRIVERASSRDSVEQFTSDGKTRGVDVTKQFSSHL